MKKRLTITALFLLINIPFLLADPGDQTDPGQACDPDLDCPLDSWVFILAATALIITVVYMHHKKKGAAGLADQR